MPRWTHWLNQSNIETIIPYTKGNGVDVCCGHQVWPGAVGIDIIPRGGVIPQCCNGIPESMLISSADLCFDAVNLPFKDGVLDFVFSSHGLEHFDDPAEVLTEWARVVKVGGFICVVVPDSRRVKINDMGHGIEPAVLTDVFATLRALEIVTMQPEDPSFDYACVAQKCK